MKEEETQETDSLEAQIKNIDSVCALQRGVSTGERTYYGISAAKLLVSIAPDEQKEQLYTRVIERTIFPGTLSRIGFFIARKLANRGHTQLLETYEKRVEEIWREVAQKTMQESRNWNAYPLQEHYLRFSRFVQAEQAIAMLSSEEMVESYRGMSEQETYEALYDDEIFSQMQETLEHVDQERVQKFISEAYSYSALSIAKQNHNRDFDETRARNILRIGYARVKPPVIEEYALRQTIKKNRRIGELIDEEHNWLILEAAHRLLEAGADPGEVLLYHQNRQLVVTPSATKN